MFLFFPDDKVAGVFHATNRLIVRRPLNLLANSILLSLERDPRGVEPSSCAICNAICLAFVVADYQNHVLWHPRKWNYQEKLFPDHFCSFHLSKNASLWNVYYICIYFFFQYIYIYILTCMAIGCSFTSNLFLTYKQKFSFTLRVLVSVWSPFWKIWFESMNLYAR